MFLIPHSLRWNPTSTLLTAAFHPPIRPHPFKEHCYSLQSHKTPSSSDVLPSNPKTALQAYTLLPHTYTHIHTTTTSTHLPTHLVDRTWLDRLAQWCDCDILWGTPPYIWTMNIEWISLIYTQGHVPSVTIHHILVKYGFCATGHVSPEDKIAKLSRHFHIHSSHVKLYKRTRSTHLDWIMPLKSA